MNDLHWKFITFKPWRFAFFRLEKTERIDDMHMKSIYVPRTLKQFWSKKPVGIV